jgi:hypothetical protein
MKVVDLINVFKYYLINLRIFFKIEKYFKTLLIGFENKISFNSYFY